MSTPFLVIDGDHDALLQALVSAAWKLEFKHWLNISLHKRWETLEKLNIPNKK